MFPRAFASRRARILPASVFFLSAISGCAQVLGLGDYQEGSGSGGSGGVASTGSTSSSKSTGTGSGGSGGGPTMCVPAMVETCYDGPTLTQHVGNCADGMHKCLPDGMSYGPCVGEVKPAPGDDCAKAGDENCDGFACGDTTWAFGAGDSAFSSGYAVARDPAGNSYFVGDFPSSLVFGGTTLDSAGQYDIFVTKVDPSGTVLWAKRFGSAGVDAVLDVAATATHVYVLTANAVNFGTGLGTGMTLAKLDAADGAPAWSRSCNQTVGAYVGDDIRQGGLVVEPGGNAYFTVQTSGAALTCTSSIGQQTFAAGNAMLIKYTSAGDTSWGRPLNGSTFFVPWDLAADPTGGLYLAGGGKGTINLGCGTSSTAVEKAVLAKFDASGNCVRVAQWGDGAQVAESVAVDATGNVAVGGYNDGGSINFGGQTLSGTGALVAHFDPAGVHQWSKQFPSGHYSTVYSVGVDPSGDIFAGGLAGPGLDLGLGPAPSGTLGYLIKLSKADGSPLWSRNYPGRLIDLAMGSHVSVIGDFQGTIQLGSHTLMGSATGNDIYFMSVDP